MLSSSLDVLLKLSKSKYYWYIIITEIQGPLSPPPHFLLPALVIPHQMHKKKSLWRHNLHYMYIVQCTMYVCT